MVHVLVLGRKTILWDFPSAVFEPRCAKSLCRSRIRLRRRQGAPRILCTCTCKHHSTMPQDNEPHAAMVKPSSKGMYTAVATLNRNMELLHSSTALLAGLSRPREACPKPNSRDCLWQFAAKSPAKVCLPNLWWTYDSWAALAALTSMLAQTPDTLVAIHVSPALSSKQGTSFTATKLMKPTSRSMILNVG